MKRTVLKWGSIVGALAVAALLPGMANGDAGYKAMTMLLLVFTAITAAGYWAAGLPRAEED